MDLAPYTVVGLMLEIGDAEKFPHALGFENLDLFLRVSEQRPCSTAIEEDGCDNSLVGLELVYEAGVAPPDPA